MIDKRLLAIADLILSKDTKNLDKENSSIVIDIGTDHAFLLSYLYEKCNMMRLIGTDIHKNPLERAKAASINKPIEFYLSDGFKDLPPLLLKNIASSKTDIIIAGMGGETVIKIIKDLPFLLSLDNEKSFLKNLNFILQPMTKHELLRKYLYENGFAIKTELFPISKGRVYVVMNVYYTGEIRKLSEKVYFFGEFTKANSYNIYEKSREKRYSFLS